MNPQEDYRITQDGDQWCATAPGFIDLQSSTAAFGDTPAQAFAHLLAVQHYDALPRPRENPKLLKGTRKPAHGAARP